MTTIETNIHELPRIEDYRADLTAEEIEASQAWNTRSIAMQAYLHAFPAFLHMRQLTEWAKKHAATLGKQYTSEVAQRTDRKGAYFSNLIRKKFLSCTRTSLNAR